VFPWKSEKRTVRHPDCAAISPDAARTPKLDDEFTDSMQQLEPMAYVPTSEVQNTADDSQMSTRPSAAHGRQNDP
jgi:hypothetical protein